MAPMVRPMMVAMVIFTVGIGMGGLGPVRGAGAQPAEPGPMVGQIESTAIAPLDPTDARRIVVEQVLGSIFDDRFAGPDGIDLRIDAGRWLAKLRRELESPPIARHYVFRAFATPGHDRADNRRRGPFDLSETLRRVYVNTAFLCLGSISPTRLIFEARRQTVPPQRWQIAVDVRCDRRGEWRVVEIVDPTHLTFCLIERRGPYPAASAPTFPAFFLVSPTQARAACWGGQAPPPLRLLDRDEFLRMGLSDPTAAPMLLIAEIDATAQTVRFNGTTTPPTRTPDGADPALTGPTWWRIGHTVTDALGHTFRIHGLDAHRVTLKNWASRAFVLDSRHPELPLQTHGYVPIESTVPALPPVDVRFVGRSGLSAAFTVARADGTEAQMWASVGDWIVDGRGAGFRLTAFDADTAVVESFAGHPFTLAFQRR